MLTYKNSVVTFVLVISALLALNFFTPVHVGWFLLVTLLFLLSLFYGSYFINSGFYLPVECRSVKNTTDVALTFDDGPSALTTPKILDILQSNNIRATFFCIGKKMQQHPELVQRIDREGHLIGNHSFSHHFFFDLFPKDKMRSELRVTNDITREITGHTPYWFRPPYGVTTPVLAKAIRSIGMKPAGWSLRSYDTVIKEQNRLVSKVSEKVKGGDIILLHDTERVTADSLQLIINDLKNKKLNPVRLDELLNTKAYA
jgi:peptidoglycan-N-acetylglucosamine deacetylase